MPTILAAKLFANFHDSFKWASRDEEYHRCKYCVSQRIHYNSDEYPMESNGYIPADQQYNHLNNCPARYLF